MKKAPGRNRYQKKCAVCGDDVLPFKGFLRKGEKGFDVFHEECKDSYNLGTRFKKPSRKKNKQSSPKKDEIEPNSTVGLISILERKLEERQKNGEPVVYLPYIIQELHAYVELKARMAGLEK